MSNTKRKLDELFTDIKLENANDGPATKKIKRAQENYENEVIVTDEVIIKNEIKIEQSTREIDDSTDDNDDVIISSVIESKNNDTNQQIDLAQADDMNCLVKFCPNCKTQANRTQKDIDQRCSIMTCINCNEWTYWCWDCNTVVDMERRDMRCVNCRKISREKRNSKNSNKNIKKEKEESDESNGSDEFKDKNSNQKTILINEEKMNLLMEITEKDLSQSVQLKTEALNNFIANDITNAENKYLNALKYNPNDYMIYLQLAKIYFRKSSYYKALISAFQAITFNPSNREAWIVYGKSWMKLKNFKFARIAFDAAETLICKNCNCNLDNQDIEYDEEYIACKSELDTFANDFRNSYTNRLDAKIKETVDAEIENDQHLKNLLTKHQGMSEELMDKLHESNCLKPLMTGEEIFALVMESKYKSFEHIHGLKQISNCWNLTVEPKGLYKPMDKNFNSSESNPMQIDTEKYIFDFEKMVFHVQLCNSTSGTVVWCNKGHHGYNPSVWSDMEPHIIFGKPTAMQVVDIIKRRILYHRNGFQGEWESVRPSNIVLAPILTDEKAVIESELKKMNIGCYLAMEECPVSIHFGHFNIDVNLDDQF